ncbi:MAG: tRNA (adenosine(37)-N6)-dimethylallyltransferase MiaA [Patescibacteria group bacterium]
MEKLLVICGPTGAGKTQLGLRLAKRFNGELVSADSRQVYRGMDIGTGKDIDQFSIFNFQFSVQFKKHKYKIGTYSIQHIPVWMYDVVDPDEEFSAAHYAAIAGAVTTDILDRGKLPVIVGGTGLYINALLGNIQTLGIVKNHKLRERLANASLVQLQEELQKKDPETWNYLNTSDRGNPRRLVRKIEIAMAGRPKERREIKPWDIFRIGLTMPPAQLYRNIDRRVEYRVAHGAIAEIEMLRKRGYDWDLPSMSALGYREWEAYMENKNEQRKNDAISTWKLDEHAYARRQMTWFKKQKETVWIERTTKGWEEEVDRRVGTWYTKK